MTRAEDAALLGPVAVVAARQLALAAPPLTEQGRAVLAAILRRPHDISQPDAETRTSDAA